MNVLGQIRRKRQRTEGLGVPVVPVIPVVPRPVSQVEVVDVEAEPDTASLSNVPPVTEPVGEEPSSPPRTKAGSKSSGKGKVPVRLGGPPLVIYPEILEGEGDEEHQQYVQHYKARLL